MNIKVTIVVAAVAAALVLLVTTAVRESSRQVVTVETLVSQKVARNNIRLGARVAEREIQYETQPGFLLRFSVHGMTQTNEMVPVVYHGIMPDTLKIGRDVILEGDFDGKQFTAKTLLTQCPSKYEPPKGPGAKPSSQRVSRNNEAASRS